MFEIFVSLSALILIEVVLGIDNVVFIAVVSEDLPEEQRPRARTLGLIAAMCMRILLLFAISWVMGLTKTLFTIFTMEVSGRDVILLAGGLFLIGKATQEIYKKVEGAAEQHHDKQVQTFRGVLIQIVLLDLVFSLDSVITAVGMVRELWMMIVAVVVASIVMVIFANPIARFVTRHPSVKVLALSFLILIGVMLVMEGMGQHINRGYIYFAMFFSLSVELINLRVRKKSSSKKVTAS